MPTVAIGQRRHLVRLENPGVPVPDGDGGFTQAWTALVPATQYAEIKPATAKDLERLMAGTDVSTATHILTMPFHAGVTTKTRVSWTDPARREHTANVTGVDTPDGRCIETIAILAEIVA